MKNTLQGKGHNSVLHYNLPEKFFPMPQAMKISDAKAAVETDGKGLRHYQRGSWKKSKAKRRS